MRMRTSPQRRPQICTLAPVLLLFLTGCETARDYSVTGRLWEKEVLGHYFEPAPNAHLQLFYDQRRGDVLAAYDEEHTKRRTIRRRAYFVNRNRARIEAVRKPRFVDPKRALAHDAIPLTPSVAAAAPNNSLQANLSSDGRQFTLSGGPVAGTYRLPVYPDQSRRLIFGTRIVATPFAVAADLAVAGIVVAAIAGVIYGISQGAVHPQ